MSKQNKKNGVLDDWTMWGAWLESDGQEGILINREWRSWV